MAKNDLPRGLFRVPNSKYLYFKIVKRDPETGKNIWSSPQSSKTTDIAVALKTKQEAQMLSDELAEAKPDIAMSHAAALEMANRVLAWHGMPKIAQKRVPRWEDVRDSWLKTEKVLFRSRAANPDMKGYKVYLSRIAQFDKWLDGQNPLVNDIKREDAQLFYSDLLDLGYRSSTIKATIKVLRRIFQQAIDEGHTDINPWARIKTIGNQYRQNDPFTLEDIDKICSNLNQLAYADEWKTACLLAINLGVRIKDSTIRTWDEIVLGDMPHIIFEPGKNIHRADSKHTVKAPLVNPLLAHLEQIETQEYLTPNLAKLPTETLSNIFSGFLRDLDIPMRIEKGIHDWYSKGFHSWRHTLPSMMASNDTPAEIRMQIVGHSTEQTHINYTHHEDKVLRKHLEDSLAEISF